MPGTLQWPTSPMCFLWLFQPVSKACYYSKTPFPSLYLLTLASHLLTPHGLQNPVICWHETQIRNTPTECLNCLSVENELLAIWYIPDCWNWCCWIGHLLAGWREIDIVLTPTIYHKGQPNTNNWVIYESHRPKQKKQRTQQASNFHRYWGWFLELQLKKNFTTEQDGEMHTKTYQTSVPQELLCREPTSWLPHWFWLKRLMQLHLLYSWGALHAYYLCCSLFDQHRIGWFQNVISILPFHPISYLQYACASAVLVENQKLLKTLIFPCPSAVALHTPATANLWLHICVVPVLPVQAQTSKTRKNSGDSLSLKHT